MRRSTRHDPDNHAPPPRTQVNPPMPPPSPHGGSTKKRPEYLDLPKALGQIDEAARLLSDASYSLFEKSETGPLMGTEPLLVGGLSQAVGAFAELLRTALIDGPGCDQ